MSKERTKGTLGENGWVNFLISNGFPHAERRALHGINDKGDVTGTIGLAWEIKNHKKYAIGAWLRELAIEKKNAKADHAFLIVKPNGVGVENAGKWWAIMYGEDLVNLVREAGYGDRLPVQVEP